MIIGKNYQKFNEAKELVALGGVLSVDSREAFAEVMNSLVNSAEKREIVGNINRDYITAKKGATNAFLKGI